MRSRGLQPSDFHVSVLAVTYTTERESRSLLQHPPRAGPHSSPGGRMRKASRFEATESEPRLQRGNARAIISAWVSAVAMSHPVAGKTCGAKSGTDTDASSSLLGSPQNSAQPLVATTEGSCKRLATAIFLQWLSQNRVRK